MRLATNVWIYIIFWIKIIIGFQLDKDRNELLAQQLENK